MNVNNVLRNVSHVKMSPVVNNARKIITYMKKLVLNHVPNNIIKIKKNKNARNVQKILKFVHKILFNNVKKDLPYMIINV